MTVYSKIDHHKHLSQCLPNCEKTLINSFKKFLHTIYSWVERSHQRKQLAKLDDRMLEDIGMTRIEANREINKPFWK